MTILDTDPTNYLSIEDREEEQTLTMLATFIDKVWTRLDESEPSADDYYNYM